MEHVLVVDDDPAICRALTRELRSQFQVTVANGYTTALAHLNATQSIRAVVSDFSIGGEVNGVDLLAEVHRRWPHCRCILLSGTVYDEELSNLQATGAFDCLIAKPWEPGEVLKVILG